MGWWILRQGLAFGQPGGGPSCGRRHVGLIGIMLRRRNLVKENSRNRMKKHRHPLGIQNRGPRHRAASMRQGPQGRKGDCANKDVVFAHSTIAGPPTATRLRPPARGCPEARGATPEIHARQDAPTPKGLRPWGGPAPSPRHRLPRRDTTPLGLGGIRLRCPRVAAGTPQPGASGWNPVGVRKASRDPPPPVLATQTQRRSQERPSQPFPCLLPAYGMPVGKKVLQLSRIPICAGPSG